MIGCNTCCFWIEEEESLSPELSQENDGMIKKKRGKTEKECSILFDEDRFYHLKRLRSKGSYIPLFNDKDYHVSSSNPEEAMTNKENKNNDTERAFSKLNNEYSYALSPDHFYLILNTFLRGQLMSVYLSSQSKDSMCFW